MDDNVKIWKYTAVNNGFTIYQIGNASNLDEGSNRFSAGIYTTFRTYQHEKALRLEDHFDRLERSAQLQGRPMTVDRGSLQSAIREILKHFPETDSRIRIHCAFEKDAIETYIMAEPFVGLPESLYLIGAAAETIELQRENPVSKATSFIDQTRHLRETKPSTINEYLMIGKDGNFLEGLSSNIFVLGGGEIWTASEGILPGITRSVVLDVIKSQGIKIRYSGYPFTELSSASEVFITSASRGVLPITRINGIAVGDGKPGDVTRLVRSEYDRWLQSELRVI